MSAFDPPGDPGGVRAAADRVGAVAGSARHLAAAIRAQGAGTAAPGVWAGQDAGAFREAVGVVADGLVQDADRLDSARTSLRTYADCLERAQATVASIQDEIGDLRDDESDDLLAPVDHGEEIRRLERKVEQVRGDAKVAGNATAASLDGLQPAEVPGPGPIATALTGLTELADGFGQAAAPYVQMLLPTPLKGLVCPSAAEHGASLGGWAVTTWQDPAAGLEQARAWVVSGLRDAVAAEDWERGDWVAGLGRTLLPDAAYEIGAAEVAWMGRTWQDPAAGFAEARDFLGGKLGGLVQADLWRQGRWVEAGARILTSDEAVDDWRHGHQARAVGRLVPDMIIDLLTGGEAKAVTATKVVTGEVIESAAEITTRGLAKDTVTIIDGDDLVIRAETVPDGWVAASDPPARLADAVPDPKPVQPPAPLAIDDPALRADQLTRLRDWFLEQARLFDYSVSDGGRRISLHTAADTAGQAIENFWQRYGREMWLAEPGRKVVSIHGALDFGAFAVGFNPSDFAIPLTPKGLAQWLRPALAEGELSEVLLLACKAGALDAGLQSRIAARIDQVVAGLAGSVPDDLGPALRRVVGDVLANQATEAAGGKPYLGWAVSKWLYEERDRMWRDRQLGGLYETITSPWQLRLKENSGTADALGRLTPEQLDALLDQGMDAYARHQGRTTKAMNQLEAGLMDQLDQLPWTHTGADIEAAVRAKVAEAVNAAMGPAADVGLIDRIATAVDERLSQWLSNGIDETTVTRITEAVGPVLAANADTLGDRARQFLDDLTGAMADEIAKAYDATLAQQFADELGVPVIGGRQNVIFMRDGSAWGVAGFKEPWKYGMRRFLPKGSVPPDVPGAVGPLPPLLEGDALAQAVAAGQDDGWLNWLRRLVHWPEAGPPPAAAIPATIDIPTHPDVLERARKAWATADRGVYEHQSIHLPDGPGFVERYQDYKLEADRLELARIWARADVVRAYQAAGLAVPPEGRVLTAVADLHTAMARYRARYAEFADQPPLAYLDDPELQALNAAEGAAGAELRAAQQAMYDALEQPIDPVMEARLRAREAASAPAPGQPVVYVYDGFLDPANYVDQVPPGLRDMVEAEIARAQAHGVAIGTPERPLRVLTNSLTAAALGAREGLLNLPTDTIHLSTLFPLRTLAEQRAIVAHEWHHAVTGALQIPAGAHAEANAASEALSKTAEGVSNPAMWPVQRDVPNPRRVEVRTILAPGDLGPSKFLQGPIYAPGTDGFYNYSYGSARVFAAAMGEVSRRYPAQFEELFYRVSTGPPGSIQGTDDLARAFRAEAARRWGGRSGIASLVDRALTRAGWPP